MTCEEIAITVSSKVKPATLPGPVYIELGFPSKHFRLLYLLFQNYYTAAITLKQQQQERWVTVLRSHKLTNAPHFENEAQNWHLLTATTFSSEFEPENFSKLRIYLTQPSPNWLDFGLKGIKCYSVLLSPIERPLESRRSSFQLLKDQIVSRRSSAQASASKPQATVISLQSTMTLSDLARKFA